MKTFTEYWKKVVIPNFPNYWSSDIIAWEQDAWNAYNEAETEEDKKKALDEIRRLNHIIADAVVDSLIDKEVVDNEPKKDITLSMLEEMTPEELLNKFPYTKENLDYLQSLFNDDNVSDEDYFDECYEVAEKQLKENK